MIKKKDICQRSHHQWGWTEKCSLGLVSFILHHLNNTVTTKRRRKAKHWLDSFQCLLLTRKASDISPAEHKLIFLNHSDLSCVFFFISYLETRTLSPQNNREEGAPPEVLSYLTKAFEKGRLLDLMHSFKCTLLKDKVQICFWFSSLIINWTSSNSKSTQICIVDCPRVDSYPGF